MITVESVGELIDVITNQLLLDNEIRWFRGQSCATWNLLPTILRNFDIDKERDFTNRFRSRAGTRYRKIPDYKNLAAWLGLMQHYGLPTRLLDWSRSPLIALYFALEGYIYEGLEQRDACLWILKPHIMNAKEGFGNVTPSIDAYMCREMLSPAFHEKGAENDKTLAVMAAEVDGRMFVQQGCFTIHSYRGPLNEREGHENYLSAIKIPKEKVKEMAFAIDVCGFRKGDIFPDLEHLAGELKGRWQSK